MNFTARLARTGLALLLLCLHLPLMAQLAVLLAAHGVWPVLVRATTGTNAGPVDVLLFRTPLHGAARPAPWRRWLFAALREQHLDQLPALMSVLSGAVPFSGHALAPGEATAGVRRVAATSLLGGLWLAGCAAAVGSVLAQAVNELLSGLAVSFLAVQVLGLAILLYSLAWPVVVCGGARPVSTWDRGSELERAG